MLLNEFRLNQKMSFEELGQYLNRSMWTVRRWCETDREIEFEGNYVMVYRAKEQLHRVRKMAQERLK